MSSCRHLEGFTTLYFHLGPHGDQDVHLHQCFTEGCDRVIVGDGRTCDPSGPHRRAWMGAPSLDAKPEAGPVPSPRTATPVAELLAEFHEAFGQPFGHGPGPETKALRKKLHGEEHQELIDAIDSGDLVAIAHELADVVYVAYGTAHSLGIPLDAVIAEVHRANMTKLGPDGKPLMREDGKVIKSPSYVPPDIGAVLEAAGIEVSDQ